MKENGFLPVVVTAKRQQRRAGPQKCIDSQEHAQERQREVIQGKEKGNIMSHKAKAGYFFYKSHNHY